MKIAIIGGSGFVGTRLIEILINERIDVINLDKRNSFKCNNITKIVDVRDYDVLQKALNGVDAVVLLAAEHRDDVTPTSLYYDVNVQGMKNTLYAMEKNGVNRIVFTSSVAVYGLNKKNPNEEHNIDPFNHYGKSKWEAEVVLQDWYKTHPNWNINIIRPTVIFGERNRGNVYNLLKQISVGRFLMIGSGNNQKSMAYVGNVVAFIKYLIENKREGYNVYNYVDKPDLTMNQLVRHVGKVLNKNIPSIKVPFAIGIIGGYTVDLVAKLTKIKFSVSSVRVKKFCATTQFDANKAHTSGFKASYSLENGLERTLKFEFVEEGAKDGIIFKSE